MKIVPVFLIILLFSGCSGIKQDQPELKPKVIVMTDGEGDDRASMVRFLMYTSELDVKAIIETNSIFQHHGHSHEGWYDSLLIAYEEVYPNLKIHNSGYPTPAYLKSVSYVGDEDIEHIKYTQEIKRRLLRPGRGTIRTPDEWEDTPGSDRIVEVLLEDDPAPVYIQAWGGGNTAARAFYKLKTEYPEDYKRAVSKAVMYNIWYQDYAGGYIENNHPGVTMIWCGTFDGTWDYGSQMNSFDYIKENVKNNHGPLGALYAKNYICEGDSPSFLYTLGYGLKGYLNPGYGGWGGRFERDENLANVFIDAEDDGDKFRHLARWIEDANNDFKARMDWCVSSNYEKANHIPVAIIKSENEINIKSGKKLKLDASRSYDPDGNMITYRWWQYKEAGSYQGLIDLSDTESAVIELVAPIVSEPETIHIILEVKDDGDPLLTNYQRIIINILP